MRTFDRMSLLIWSLVLAIIALHLGYLFHFNNSPLVWSFIHHTNFVCGWLGSILMLLSLLYIPRKQKLFTWGKVHSWYNFHIAAGLLGPILIFFHSYGKYNGFGGLALICMWIVFFTGVIGYYIYRRLNEEIEYKMKLREKILRKLDEIDKKMAESALISTEFKQKLSSAGLAAPLYGGSSTQPSLKKDPRKLKRLWQDFRESHREIKTLKNEVVSQNLFEQRTASQKKQAFNELLLLESSSKNYLMMKEIFSLWRICHVPISWFMWMLVTLHISGWLYY